MQALMTKEGSWVAIDGPVQVAMTGTGPPSPADRHADASAKSSLILNIAGSLQYLVKDDDTASQAWTRIKNTFESKVRARSIMLHQP